MKNFKQNYEKFDRRVVKERFTGAYDFTGMRFIDTATEDEILKEYELIKDKKSKLSSKQRDLIVKMVEL